MSTTTSSFAPVKRMAIIAIVFLASMGLGYSVIKYLLADQPDVTFLLPLFIISISILVWLFSSAKLSKH